jgi:hypothetical protein
MAITLGGTSGNKMTYRKYPSFILTKGDLYKNDEYKIGAYYSYNKYTTIIYVVKIIVFYFYLFYFSCCAYEMLCLYYLFW